MAKNQAGRGHCAACKHPDHDALDQALIMKSESITALGRKYGIDRTNLASHKKNHLSPALVTVRQQLLQTSVATALSRVEKMIAFQEGILYPTDSKLAPNLNQATQIMKEYRSTIELYAKITGELDERPQTTINLASSAEWIQLRTAILRALIPHPSALQAVTQGLRKVAGGMN